MTHKLVKVLRTPEDTIEDAATTLTANSELVVGNDAQPFPVSSYSGNTSNDINVNMSGAVIASMVFLSTVPCVITFTGITAIDGVTATTLTLAANVMRQVLAVTGTLTKIRVGPNTDNGGAEGAIKIRLLYEVSIT
jgi:hypothetical protein